MHRTGAHRQQAIEWLADHLGFSPFEDVLGTAVEAYDTEFFVERNDRVGRDVDDRGEGSVRMRVSHTLNRIASSDTGDSTFAVSRNAAHGCRVAAGIVAKW